MNSVSQDKTTARAVTSTALLGYGFTLIELLVVITIIGILLSLVGGCFLGASCSEGDRVGIVTKISRNGVVWKTWEGEMQIGGGVVGTAAQNWPFSVREDGPVDEIKTAMESGHRVRLTYVQSFFVPPWKGETTYRITEVKYLSDVR